MKTIIVEGIIGAGKTSLSSELMDALGEGTLYLTEPDEQGDANPYLADYYDDPGRWAFVMQVHLLQVRYRMHQQAQWHALNGFGHAVMDRSYFGDVAFAHLQLRLGHLTARQFATYTSLYKCMTASVLYPNVCVYLDTDPQVAYERIHRRLEDREGRKCEEAVSLGYLKDLRDEVEVVLRALEDRGTTVLRLPWSTDRATPESREYAVNSLAAAIAKVPSRSEFADIYTRRT